MILQDMVGGGNNCFSYFISGNEYEAGCECCSKVFDLIEPLGEFSGFLIR